MHQNVIGNGVRLGRGHEPGGDLAVQIPVNEPDGEWIRCFPEVAEASNLAARVERLPSRLVLHVTFSADSDREEVVRHLDATVELIARAKALHKSRSDQEDLAAGWVRDWASGQGSR